MIEQDAILAVLAECAKLDVIEARQGRAAMDHLAVLVEQNQLRDLIAGAVRGRGLVAEQAALKASSLLRSSIPNDARTRAVILRASFRMEPAFLGCAIVASEFPHADRNRLISRRSRACEGKSRALSGVADAEPRGRTLADGIRGESGRARPSA